MSALSSDTLCRGQWRRPVNSEIKPPLPAVGSQFAYPCRFFKAAASEGKTLYIPPLPLCGDNGAMIGCQAYYEYKAGKRAGMDLNAYATMDAGDLYA